MAKGYTLEKGFRVDRGWEDALRSLSSEDFRQVFWLLYDYQMSGGSSAAAYRGTNALARTVVSLIVPQIDSRLEGAVGGKLAQQKRARAKKEAENESESEAAASVLPDRGGSGGGTDGESLGTSEGYREAGAREPSEFFGAPGTVPNTEQYSTEKIISDEDRTERNGPSSSSQRDGCFSEGDDEETVRLYGELCPSLAPAPALTPPMRAQLRQAMQNRTPEQMRQLFEKAESTPFLRGEGSKGWRASLPWLLKNGERVMRDEYAAYTPPAVTETRESSFDGDEFFQAALRRSYGGRV